MSLKKKKKKIKQQLSVPDNTEKIRHAYKSKHNLKRKNQVILLMTNDGEKWHYLAVKKNISITQMNNIKSCWRLLLFKLFSFIQNKRCRKHENRCKITIIVIWKCLKKIIKY